MSEVRGSAFVRSAHRAVGTTKAWQRIRREECAEEDRNNLFGAWWTNLDTDLERATVREIDQRTASVVVEKYEWMRSMPAIAWHCYGLFFADEALGGVVVYGPDYAENLGVWDRYGYSGRLVLLSRGVTLHWAHPHTSSFLIRRSMALLPEKYEVVTAIVDPRAGEVGTVYQAANFVYAGSMDSHTRGEIRASTWEINGRRLTERSLRAVMGGRFTASEVHERFPHAIVTREVAKGDPPAKGRYFAFRGDRPARRRDFAAIEHFVRPYPKRAEGVEETPPAIQSGNGGAMPSLRFQPGAGKRSTAPRSGERSPDSTRKGEVDGDTA